MRNWLKQCLESDLVIGGCIGFMVGINFLMFARYLHYQLYGTPFPLGY